MSEIEKKKGGGSRGETVQDRNSDEGTRDRFRRRAGGHRGWVGGGPATKRKGPQKGENSKLGRPVISLGTFHRRPNSRPWDNCWRGGRILTEGHSRKFNRGVKPRTGGKQTYEKRWSGTPVPFTGFKRRRETTKGPGRKRGGEGFKYKGHPQRA